MTPRQCFIVPDLEGPISGGTLYNRQLIAALVAAGVDCSVLELGRAAQALRDTEAVFWLDSLFLSALPELHAAAPGRLGLILHYLPSLLEPRGGPSAAERFALGHVDRFLLPSVFMKQTLEARGARGRRLLVVEPGRPAAGSTRPARGRGVRALLVANLTPNKGVEPLLAALADGLSSGDDFALDVIGSLDADADYAAACRRRLEHPLLRERVRLLGALAPEQVAEHMSRSNLLLSASRMESYGMVLGEARALGLPIVALAAGNTPAHVLPGAGGELVASDAELARACARLCRDAAEHERRLGLAHGQRLAARPWAQAACELLAQLSATAPGTTA